MSRDKIQFPVLLDPEDYEWIEHEAEQTDNSKAGVIREAVRLYRATGGLLGPARMEMAQQSSVDVAESGSKSTDNSSG
jgi:hypothetical protein